MKKIIGLVLSLTIIAGICAAVLAYVDTITRQPIADMKVRQENAAVMAVMPAGVQKVELADGFYLGKDATGKVIGYAAKGVDSKGYGGDIVLMVGFRSDRKTVECYKTLVASETPGLGSKLRLPEFSSQFSGKDGSSLKVKKDGGIIEAITSATITSRAVCRAIADAAAKIR